LFAKAADKRVAREITVLVKGKGLWRFSAIVFA